jgi:dCTP deaminase
MSGHLVRQYIIKRIENEQLVENSDIGECVKPASYELRVGSYYDWQLKERVSLKRGEAIALAPNGFLLVGSMETVNIPTDIIGMMYLRSTYARRGFVSWFQGIVDPGYKGGLTFALHNLTRDLVAIYGAERICHLVFEQLPEPVEEGYQGAYQGLEGATPPLLVQAFKIIGEKTSEQASGSIEAIPKALYEELLKNPELLKRLLY